MLEPTQLSRTHTPISCLGRRVERGQLWCAPGGYAGAVEAVVHAALSLEGAPASRMSPKYGGVPGDVTHFSAGHLLAARLILA